MQVEVAFLPRDITHISRRVALVIDVIRATSTLVAAFERGARWVALANDVLSARSARKRSTATGAERPLLMGEVGGLPPDDFAFGNSPVALSTAALRGRDVIFSSSNGTRALVAVAGAAGVIAACLRNGRAAVGTALQMAADVDADLSIVCAGRAGGTQQGQDDLICAGYLVEQLLLQTGEGIAPWQPDADFAASVAPGDTGPGLALDDSALVALRLYRSVVQDPAAPQQAEIEAVFFESGAGQGLRRLGLAHDVRYCAAVDQSAVVPRLIRAGESSQYPLSIVAAI